MSDNVKKALESTDVSVIKKAFGMEAGQVTKYVERIYAILKINDENGFYNRESSSKVELLIELMGLLFIINGTSSEFLQKLECASTSNEVRRLGISDIESL